MASSIAGVVLLVAGILVVVNVSGGRPYADLPTCRQLLGDLTDEIPGADRPSVDGDRHDDDDVAGHYAGETRADALSGLECMIEDDRGGDTFQMRVSVYLYDHEDGRGLEDLQYQLEEEVQTYEDGSLEEEAEDLEILEWERSDLGDAGILTVHEQGRDVSASSTSTTAHGLFLTSNLSVSYEYELGERDGEQEAMEFVHSFGRSLERQLRSEAEFV